MNHFWLTSVGRDHIESSLTEILITNFDKVTLFKGLSETFSAKPHLRDKKGQVRKECTFIFVGTTSIKIKFEVCCVPCSRHLFTRDLLDSICFILYFTVNPK